MSLLMVSSRLYELPIRADHSCSSTEDVLKARLKTLGVSEHRFVMEARE